ncbi:MAG: GspE/PulE family protein, partial [Pseudoxanthomonas suwonensis]|nr:GspE/PulE family protein [Pseudoxanthomonas suwonensis]
MNQAAIANLVGITGIARRLVMDGALDESSARKALQDAADAKRPIAAWLLEKKLVNGMQMAAANAIEFGMPVLDLQAMNPNPEVLGLVKENLLDKHRVLPLFKRGNRLFLATGEPTATAAFDEIAFSTNLTVDPVLVDASQIKQVAERWRSTGDSLGDALGGDDIGDLEVSGGDGEETGDGSEIKDDDAPVVKFVNKVLVDAIRRGASDIHFEPFETEYRVRLRIDGVLRKVAAVPTKLSPRIAARLKVMAQLDIAEKRVPQDGRIKLNLSKTRQIDFRVSTLPTLFGEKVVLRILDGSAAKLGIEQLGYEPEQQAIFTEAIFKPYGMVLVTGPTGSGKTVSLYTGLNMLNDEGRNISTVEDPVEIRVPGINQVQQNAKRGMTFAA